MLLMSVADEVELEHWRDKSPGCKLSPLKMRPQLPLHEALDALPALMRMIMRVKLRTKGWAGPLGLSQDEVTDIASTHKLSSREIMVLLLAVSSAMATFPGDGKHIGAVAEGESGSYYIGSQFQWSGRGVKVSTHGVQSAVLSAWHNDESKITSLMVEAPPCSCCRQFLRELHNWEDLTIYQALDGPLTLDKGSITEIPLGLGGLRLEGIKQRLFDERPRVLSIAKTEKNDLVNAAAEAASHSYAPYSENSAGIAVRTRNGLIYTGRHFENRESIAGLLAIESALVNIHMSGNDIDAITELLLVETRGTITQFSPTQKFVTAMGGLPFRFMMTS